MQSATEAGIVRVKLEGRMNNKGMFVISLKDKETGDLLGGEASPRLGTTLSLIIKGPVGRSYGVERLCPSVDASIIRLEQKLEVGKTFSVWMEEGIGTIFYLTGSGEKKIELREDLLVLAMRMKSGCFTCSDEEEHRFIKICPHSVKFITRRSKKKHSSYAGCGEYFSEAARNAIKATMY